MASGVDVAPGLRGITLKLERVAPRVRGTGRGIMSRGVVSRKEGMASRVGEVAAIGDVGGDGGAPAQPAITSPTPTRAPRRRPPERLRAVPEGHQTRPPHAQSASVPALRGRGGGGRGGG